jgi:hypothetical protein
MQNNIGELHKIIGEVIGNRIIDMAHSGNYLALKQLGIGNATCKKILSESPVDVNNAVAKGIKFSVDENIFTHNLAIISRIKQEQNLLNKWVGSGCCFEMCRNFFVSHTSHKHTDIRSYLGIGKISEVKKIELSDKQRNDFFDFLWNLKGGVSAAKLDEYATNNNIAVKDLWQPYKEYLKNGADANCES